MHQDERGDRSSEDRQEVIRRRAYERWNSEGRPEGRDVDHWVEAEREVGEGGVGEGGSGGEKSPRKRRDPMSAPPPRGTTRRSGPPNS